MEKYLLPVRDAVENWLQNFDRMKYPDDINQDLLDDLSKIMGFASCMPFVESEYILSTECRELVQKWTTLGLVSQLSQEQLITRSLYLCDIIREQVLVYGFQHRGPVGFEFTAQPGHNVTVSVYSLLDLVFDRDETISKENYLS